jgi:hypothetical protein
MRAATISSALPRGSSGTYNTAESASIRLCLLMKSEKYAGTVQPLLQKLQSQTHKRGMMTSSPQSPKQ